MSVLAIPPSGHSLALRLGRWTFALSALAAWMSLGRILRVDGIPYPRGLSALVDLSWLVTPAAALVTTVLFGACALVFARARSGALAAAAVMSALLALGTHLFASQWPGDAGSNRATSLPGASLAALVLVTLVAGRGVRGASRDERARERLGVDAAAGIVAASYALAGLSKLSGSGVGWAMGQNLAMHIASHAFYGVAWLRPLRESVAEQLWLCTALGVATLVIECSFVLFVLRPMRLAYAALGSAMHLGIGAIMGLHHYDWMLGMLGVALWSAAHDARERADVLSASHECASR